MIAGVSDTEHRISHQLVEELRSSVPPGVGSWSLTWELVDEPTAAFNGALNDFMASNTISDGLRVVSMARAVVASWVAAARAWEAEGRPMDLSAGSGREEDHLEKEWDS